MDLWVSVDGRQWSEGLLFRWVVVGFGFWRWTTGESSDKWCGVVPCVADVDVLDPPLLRWWLRFSGDGGAGVRRRSCETVDGFGR